MEIPINHLKDFVPFTDFDFCLAHLVLQNELYAKFYSGQRQKGREVWLDNSLIELGYPMEKKEMLYAAQICCATHIIPPDWPEEPERTMETAVEWKKGLSYKIIGVVHGNFETQKKVLDEYRKNNILPSLPFRGNRVWVTPSIGSFHFLGMNSLREIHISQPSSIDTKLPLKLALQNKTLGINFSKKSPTYTYGATELDLINTKLTLVQTALACYNIMKIRSALWTY
jgi:hypothetical protein